MPGLVAFNRRWSIGSDDLVVPGLLLLLLHLSWLVTLSVLLACRLPDPAVLDQWLLVLYTALLSLLLFMCSVCEALVVIVAMRGSILDTKARANMQYLIYFKLLLMGAEVGWLIAGFIWVHQYYRLCEARFVAKAVISCMSCQFVAILCTLMTVWCSYDPAGRSWLKMRRFQEHQNQQQHSRKLKRSSGQRNWRQRKVLRAYRNSWNTRCRFLFCCVDKDRNQSSFADIADLLSEFFRDLDVVPSDIVAGLFLLRQRQKQRQRNIVNASTNCSVKFLSGARITSNTSFIRLNTEAELNYFQEIIYYMRYAMSIYGWPLFVMQRDLVGCCHLCSHLGLCCRRRRSHWSTGQCQDADVVEDNCCGCNMAATYRMLPSRDVRFVHVTYHVNVGETPFFVAVDDQRRAVVVCVRGTMSLEDVVTDLDCGSEPIPTRVVRDNWLGHKGMIEAAVYIRDKLVNMQLLERAFALARSERHHHSTTVGQKEGTSNEHQQQQQNGNNRDQQDGYSLILVGHSLGAGTAAILALLLRDSYPDLRCFAYSPPGGLLSEPVVTYTKQFVLSVVVGKDVVPRIGLHQMEQFRTDLLQVIKESNQAKWQSIGASIVCCGQCNAVSETDTTEQTTAADEIQQSHQQQRQLPLNPCSRRVALTVHQPLYPPGRMLHIVRRHRSATTDRKKRSRREPIYQAVWVENDSFDEVLISPVMVQDHMPENVLEALSKVVSSDLSTSRSSDPPAAIDKVAHDVGDTDTDNGDDTDSLSTLRLVWRGQTAPLASPDMINNSQ